MATVNAANRDQADRIHVRLITFYPPIYADIWKFGLNVSLRISDILKLKFEDLDLENRQIRLVEQKTKKTKIVRLNQTAIGVITKRRQLYTDDVWLFQVHSNRAKDKPISRATVSAVFKEVGDAMKLKINTHSMRKSRGKALYDDGVPIEKIAKVLNHSSPAVTMAYLGITQEEVLQTYDDYEL